MLLGQIDITRQKLVKAFYAALGLYVEQEKVVSDDWTKKPIRQILDELIQKAKEIELHAPRIHELIISDKEYDENNARDILWQSCESVSCSLKLLVKVMEKIKMIP